MTQISCPKCGSKEVVLNTIVHSTQGEIYNLPMPSGRGNRVTFVLKCLKEGCLYNRESYEERAYELEDIT